MWNLNFVLLDTNIIGTVVNVNATIFGTEPHGGLRHVRFLGIWLLMPMRNRQAGRHIWPNSYAGRTNRSFWLAFGFRIFAGAVRLELYVAGISTTGWWLISMFSLLVWFRIDYRVDGTRYGCRWVLNSYVDASIRMTRRAGIVLKYWFAFQQYRYRG